MCKLLRIFFCYLCAVALRPNGLIMVTLANAEANNLTNEAAEHVVAASEATLLTTASLYETAVNHLPINQEPNEIHSEQQGDEGGGGGAEVGTKHPTRADYDEELAYVSSVKQSAASSSTLRTKQLKLSKARFKIAKVYTNCTRDLLEMRFQLNHPFNGIVYAKDFPHECRARGTAENNITLRLPTSGCGVRVEAHNRNDDEAATMIELSVHVMMQMEEKLRQSSDILKTIKCKLPLNAMGMNVIGATAAAEQAKMKQHFRHGRMQYSNNAADHADGGDVATKSLLSKQQLNNVADMETTYLTQAATAKQNTQNAYSSSATSTSSSSSSSPRVRIWLELGGPDGSGSVVVGQATTMTVRAIVPAIMGVRIVDCAALDGLGESTQQLLDERGCPIDEQVMPALHTGSKPLEEGWSKQNDDDLVEKTYTATFPAFKFPDRERLHVSCGVQLCKGRCPNVNCRTSEKLILTSDKHLARIEVFNSLAVTAPQIEIDRLRYDRRHSNMSAEEYPPYIRPLINDGTLCLSVSKLALSFCILGLIFLLAVIVAIMSLIRSRRRNFNSIHNCGTLSNNSSRLHRAEICTSMFSSSSDSDQTARFGSKLFIPYYPNTLPYGRVY